MNRVFIGAADEAELIRSILVTWYGFNAAVQDYLPTSETETVVETTPDQYNRALGIAQGVTATRSLRRLQRRK